MQSNHTTPPGPPATRAPAAAPTTKRRPGRPPTYVFDRPDAELTENERRLRSAVLKRRQRQNRSYRRRKLAKEALAQSRAAPSLPLPGTSPHDVPGVPPYSELPPPRPVFLPRLGDFVRAPTTDFAPRSLPQDFPARTLADPAPFHFPPVSAAAAPPPVSLPAPTEHARHEQPAADPTAYFRSRAQAPPQTQQPQQPHEQYGTHHQAGQTHRAPQPQHSGHHEAQQQAHGHAGGEALALPYPGDTSNSGSTINGWINRYYDGAAAGQGSYDASAAAGRFGGPFAHLAPVYIGEAATAAGEVALVQ